MVLLVVWTDLKPQTRSGSRTNLWNNLKACVQTVKIGTHTVTAFSFTVVC